MAGDHAQRRLDESDDSLEVKANLDKFQGSLLYSAIGDALGWPTEFERNLPGGKRPISDFVRWRKMVGGRWWGYYDTIEPGQYSDDTQLTLAVSRCIDDKGRFSPERFAYLELPLWLHYERGGGRSVKAAARSLIERKRDWSNNFYRHGDVDYFSAGGNGAAMRNLPLALVHYSDEPSLIADSFSNAIVTHGHPRAIVGSVLFGLAIRHALSSDAGNVEKMIPYLEHALEGVWEETNRNLGIRRWITNYNSNERTFQDDFAAALGEAIAYLSKMPHYFGLHPEQYYREVGALDEATKGSGVGSVCASIFQYLRENDRPEEAITSTVNMLGSDTDTISSFTGALFGAQYGIRVVPKHLSERLQDGSYIEAVAQDLMAAATGRIAERTERNHHVDKTEAMLRIMAWEVGLHEMFWDAIGIDGTIVHPTLGRGKVIGKKIQPLVKAGFEAKLLSVKFDSGQSCYFHSRVRQSDGQLSESFAQAIQKEMPKSVSRNHP